jgi:anti-anti-sigma factor
MTIEEDKFTIHKIREIYKKINTEFESSNQLKIDMKNVDEIDLSGLQLLISAKKSCEKNKKDFLLVNIKDELLYAFELSGVDSVLGVM